MKKNKLYKHIEIFKKSLVDLVRNIGIYKDNPELIIYIYKKSLTTG